MLNCIEKNPNGAMAEDVFYSNCVHELNDKPQAALELGNFCTQHSYFANSFGAHKIKEMDGDVQSFLEYCPEAKVLLSP